MKSASEEKSIEEFNSLATKANTLCWNFIGNVRETTIDLAPSVERVYATKDKHIIPKTKKTTEGTYICLLLKNKRPLCHELDCNVSVPYLSANASLSSLVNKLLGRPALTTYKLKLERTDFGVNITVE